MATWFMLLPDDIVIDSNWKALVSVKKMCSLWYWSFLNYRFCRLVQVNTWMDIDSLPEAQRLGTNLRVDYWCYARGTGEHWFVEVNGCLRRNVSRNGMFRRSSVLLYCLFLKGDIDHWVMNGFLSDCNKEMCHESMITWTIF